MAIGSKLLRFQVMYNTKCVTNPFRDSPANLLPALLGEPRAQIAPVSLGSARIVDQVQAFDRDSQSKRWAKSRDVGQPCETHLRPQLNLAA
jgi:hypothetical protein